MSTAEGAQPAGLAPALETPTLSTTPAPTLPRSGSSSSGRSSLTRRASDAARTVRDKMAPGSAKRLSVTAPVLAPLSPPRSPDPASAELPDEGAVTVPELLRTGVTMLKASAKRVEQRRVRLAPDEGQVVWESKGAGALNIETIRELRWAADARAFRTQLGIAAEAEPRWCTIVYASPIKKRIKLLHLIALTPDVFAQWRKALTELYEQRRVLVGGLDHMRRRQSVWLRQHWRLADTGGDGKLDMAEVTALCRRLGIAASAGDIRDKFAAADAQQRGYLDFADFQTFVRLLKRRPDIEAVVKTIADGGTFVKQEQFVRFMRTEQRSAADDETLISLYAKFSDPDASGMSTEGLTSFLMSADNTVSTEQARVSMDMTRPLCEYFISSSHNTYLVGGQLSGESTVEGYVRALQQGCRCVELDIWDGQDEPVVYHGRTLTSKITARDALTAIAKYAFVASPYPVMLSIEIHCEVPQQDQLVKIMVDTLGDALITKPLPSDTDKGKLDTLPSPEALKYRILLKFKDHNDAASTKASSSGDQVETPTESDSSSASSDSEMKRKFATALRRLKGDGPSSGPSPPQRTPDITPAKPVMSLALAALLVYTVGVKWRGFNKKETYAPSHVLSLGERTAAKTIKDAKSDLIAHNRTHLTRSYPAGTRFTSSNYLPHHLWAVGISLVAINWQTFDLGAEINAAYFIRNGKSGYVLKPEMLRNKALKEGLGLTTRYELDIEIISAQQLTSQRPRDDGETPSLDPWVEVAVYAPGIQTSDAPRRRTQTVSDNGFAPRFNASFTIPFDVPADMLELAFIRLRVCEGDGDGDKTLGKYCLSAASLQPGYRHLPLHDSLGQMFLFSSLFVRSQIRVISSPKLPSSPPLKSPRALPQTASA